MNLNSNNAISNNTISSLDINKRRFIIEKEKNRISHHKLYKSGNGTIFNLYDDMTHKKRSVEYARYNKYFPFWCIDDYNNIYVRKLHYCKNGKNIEKVYRKKRYLINMINKEIQNIEISMLLSEKYEVTNHLIIKCINWRINMIKSAIDLPNALFNIIFEY
jgi:hypothetical protein